MINNLWNGQKWLVINIADYKPPSPPPPPHDAYMITEIADNRMVTETDSDPMITE